MTNKTNSKSLLERISIILAVIGLLFFIIGLLYQVPDRTIEFFDCEKYVGGDAYNIMIEASIRAGEISGIKTTKAIYVVFGALLCITATVLRMIDKEQRKKVAGTIGIQSKNSDENCKQKKEKLDIETDNLVIQSKSSDENCEQKKEKLDIEMKDWYKKWREG